MDRELIIREPRIEDSRSSSRVTVNLDSPEGSFPVYFELTGISIQPDATPFAAMCLPLAMARGWSLRSELPISAQLYRTIDRIQDIYRFFLPGTVKIKVETPTTNKPAAMGKQGGSFFSGGVDSYYTFLKNRGRISTLIFAMGFDFRLEQTNFASIVANEIRHTARELDVGLIEVRSNIRDFSDKFVHWRYFHGAALGGTAALLEQLLDTVFIASSQHYGDLFVWGSHPILDPLWSTESVKIINDGCEARRIDKLALVVQNEVALKRLRVCFNNKNDRYNCNRCEKCLRTKVALHALGALSRCRTFQPELDLESIGKLRFGDKPNVLRANQENYEVIRKLAPNPQLERALRLAMRRPSFFRTVKDRLRAHLRPATISKVLGSKAG